MTRLMRKSPKEPVLTRSEQKAAEIDQWVKGHLAESREKEKVKTARLKALREAREAALSESKAKRALDATPRAGKRARRIWVSGPDALSKTKLNDFSDH